MSHCGSGWRPQDPFLPRYHRGIFFFSHRCRKVMCSWWRDEDPLDQLHGFWMCLGFSRLYSMFFPLQWARAPADPIMLQMKAFKAFLGEKQRKSTSQSYPYVRDISCWIYPGSVSLIISCFFWSVASLQPSHATIGAPTLGRPSES